MPTDAGSETDIERHGVSPGPHVNPEGGSADGALGRAEEALRESVRHFAGLFDHSPVGIAVLDLRGHVVRTNPSAREMLALTEDEIRGMGLARLFLDDAERAVRSIGEVARGERRHVCLEELLVRNDGRGVWANVTLYPVGNEEGAVCQVVAMMEDITERKEAGERLAQTLAELSRLEFIVNASPAVAFLWRLEEGCPVDYVSDSVRQFGYAPEEFLSGAVSWPGITHPDDVPRLEKALTAYLANDADHFTAEYRIVTRSGDVRWVEDRNLVIRNDEGEPVRIQGVALDVTDRKRAEEAHSSAERRFRTLVEQTPAVTYVAALDGESTTLYISPQIEILIGYTPGEYKADPDTWRKQLHPDDLDRVMAELAKSHQVGAQCR